MTSIDAGPIDEHDSPTLNDTRLAEVLDAYLAEIESGGVVDVEALIEANPTIAGRLRECLGVLQAVGRVVNALADELPGDDEGPGLLGDYRIVRQVGRGGMGIVYEAEQVSLGRRVALKILPFAAALDPPRLARFQVEARAAAQLHHTNIVPVFAVGHDRGVHFYAMQLIEGQSLAALIDAMRRGEDAADASTADRSNLAREFSSGRFAPAPRAGSPPEGKTAGDRPVSSSPGRARARTVAGLGLQAAGALEHAHARGVLHRDIKPANLLLDAEGRLWVTDFGLARLPADPGLTATGDLLGTVRYMSPEQARASRVLLDGRTDLYSLGVTLYELLTLRPAVEGRDRDEQLRRIAEVEPIRPRRHDASIPRDLETILLKAMAKDPADRYATARELADDLRRFLDDRAVRARRPTVPERAARWVRRHATLVVTALAALTLVAALLAAGAAALWREQTKTALALRQAEERRLEARRAVDTMYTQVARDWLEDRPKLEQVQRQFLEEALRFYDGLAREPGADPSVRREAARAAQRAGDIQRKLGLRDQAAASYRRGMGLLEQLLEASPRDPELRVELAECSMTLGYLLERVRNDEAERAHRRAVALTEGLVAEFPAALLYRRKLSQKVNNLGNAILNRGRFREAKALYERCATLSRELEALDPHEPLYRYGAGVGDFNVGQVQFARGQRRQAEATLRRATDTLERLVAEHPRPLFRMMLATSHGDRARALFERGDLDRARVSVRRSLDVMGELAESFPAVPDYREGVARVNIFLARSQLAAGQTREAEETLRKAIAIQEQLGDDPHNLSRYFARDQHEAELALGDILTAAGRPDEARACYAGVIEKLRALVAETPDGLAVVGQLARLLVACPDHRLRDPVEAIRLSARAAAEVPDEDRSWTTLGIAHYRSGNLPDARRALEKARAENPEDPIAGFVLAMVSWRMGDEASARRLFDASREATTAERPFDLEATRLRDEAASILAAPPTHP